MPRGRCPERLVDAFLADCQAGLTNKELGEKYSRHPRTVRHWKRTLRQQGRDADPEIVPEQDRPEPGTSYTETGNYASLVVTSQRLRSIEELLDAFSVDRTIWQVLRSKIGYWEGFAKNEKQNLRWSDGAIVEGFSEKDGVVIAPLYRMEATLVRREPVPIHPVVQPVECAVTYQNPPQPTDGVRRAIIGADAQLGYRLPRPGGRLVPFHDRRALDLLVQLAAYLQPDAIYLDGDYLDMTEWTDRFVRSPQYQRMTQPAILEGHWWARQLREAAPDAHMELHEGNHEKRADDYLATHLMAACDLRPADQMDLPPALSVPRLLALHALGIDWVGDYPDDLIWINERLCICHGDRASGVPGGTARAVLDGQADCVIFAHAHRREQVSQTLFERNGPRTVEAKGIGCLCRIDGEVPAQSKRNNWQQSIAIVDYTDREYSIYDLEIRNGSLIWDGHRFEARDRLADLRADLPGWSW